MNLTSVVAMEILMKILITVTGQTVSTHTKGPSILLSSRRIASK